MSQVDRSRWVGPVLSASADTEPIIEALREENDPIEVEERGSYYRVFVPRRCRVTKTAIEQQCGHEFRLPGDLERVMPAFKGRITITPDFVEWHFEEAKEA